MLLPGIHIYIWLDRDENRENIMWWDKSVPTILGIFTSTVDYIKSGGVFENFTRRVIVTDVTSKI